MSGRLRSSVNEIRHQVIRQWKNQTTVHDNAVLVRESGSSNDTDRGVLESESSANENSSEEEDLDPNVGRVTQSMAWASIDSEANHDHFHPELSGQVGKHIVTLTMSAAFVIDKTEPVKV